MNPESERRGFQPLPRGPVDVNISEKHVSSLLLHNIKCNDATWMQTESNQEVTQK